MIISRRAFLQLSAMLGVSTLVPLNLFPQSDSVEIADEHLVFLDGDLWCTAGNEIKGPCRIIRFTIGADAPFSDGVAKFALRRPNAQYPVVTEGINKRVVFTWTAPTPLSELIVPIGDKMLIESPDPDMLHWCYYRRPGPDGKYAEPAFGTRTDDEGYMDEGCCELDA